MVNGMCSKGEEQEMTRVGESIAMEVKGLEAQGERLMENTLQKRM